MTDNGSTDRMVECPACSRQLLVPSQEAFLRLRCPYCQQQFELGIAKAEVVTEPPSVAVILPENFDEMQGAAQPAPATQTPATETSGSDFTRGEKAGCAVMALVLLVAVTGGTWFLSKKREVIVIGESPRGLVVTDTYYNAPEGRLFGAAATFGRIIGMQSPAEISGPGGQAKVTEVADDAHEANDLIIVNQSKGEIWYTASVYGNQDKVDKNAELGPIKIEPGTAAVALGKTHGEYQLGCREAPRETENFGTSGNEAFDIAVLGWITEQSPQDCPNAPPALRSNK